VDADWWRAGNENRKQRQVVVACAGKRANRLESRFVLVRAGWCAELSTRMCGQNNRHTQAGQRPNEAKALGRTYSEKRAATYLVEIFCGLTLELSGRCRNE
jgi:hypothetical protein